MTAYCRACPEEIVWATMPSGKRNPLDKQTIPLDEVAAGKGIIAFNPSKRTGVPITKENADDAPRWAAAGATFHISHWATCAARTAVREEIDAGLVRECPVAGCTTTHARSMLMCREHWHALPKRLRDALWAAYNEQGVISEEYMTARDACIAHAEGR